MTRVGTKPSIAFDHLVSRALLIAVLGVIALVPNGVYGACLSLTSGPIVYDVAACKKLEPQKIFDPNLRKYRWIKDFDPVGRQKFLASYQGLLLKGKVVKSEAIQQGLSKDKGALEGQEIFLYMPPSANSCANVLTKRLLGDLQQVCCDGSGEAPCLLGTSYNYKSVKAIGAAFSGAGDDVRQKATRSASHRAGLLAHRQGKPRHAIKHLNKAKENGELDLKGAYVLGLSYREIDQCTAAVAPLQHIYKMQVEGKVWADEEKIARQAVLLLARCYAKLNEPGPAVLILNSYLLEPAKYRNELRHSLNHKDFGWIHTSKDYRVYEELAREALKRKR